MEREQQFYKLLGEIISGARLEQGLTQKELGIEMGYAENSAGQVIHKIEDGKIPIPKRKITKLLDVLQITHDKLGLEHSVSLPVWISSHGNKGGSKTIREFIASAGDLASEVAGRSETMVLEAIELSGTVVSGMAGIPDTVSTGLSQIKKLSLNKKQKQPLTLTQKQAMVEELCAGDRDQKLKICEILNIPVPP
ncbi:MAG: helix-turn-helix transcriptional regulator [SAR324 cluster bacterium]|nr:helix-turn-helix transcriptional regulator [SAR324 cluster bacterium]